MNIYFDKFPITSFPGKRESILYKKWIPALRFASAVMTDLSVI